MGDLRPGLGVPDLGRPNPRSQRAALRYLVVQVISGLLLLAGVVWRVDAGEGITFGHIGTEGTAGG